MNSCDFWGLTDTAALIPFGKGWNTICLFVYYLFRLFVCLSVCMHVSGQASCLITLSLKTGSLPELDWKLVGLARLANQWALGICMSQPTNNGVSGMSAMCDFLRGCRRVKLRYCLPSKLDCPPSISLSPLSDLKPDYLGLNLSLNASSPYAIPKKLNTSETQCS